MSKVKIETGSKPADAKYRITVTEKGPYMVFGHPPLAQHYIMLNETGEYARCDHGGEQPLPVQQQYDHHQCLRDHRACRGKHGQAGAQWRRAQTVLRPGYGGCRMDGMSLRIVLL